MFDDLTKICSTLRFFGNLSCSLIVYLSQVKLFSKFLNIVFKFITLFYCNKKSFRWQYFCCHHPHPSFPPLLLIKKATLSKHNFFYYLYASPVFHTFSGFTAQNKYVAIASRSVGRCWPRGNCDFMLTYK